MRFSSCFCFWDNHRQRFLNLCTLREFFLVLFSISYELGFQIKMLDDYFLLSLDFSDFIHQFIWLNWLGWLFLLHCMWKLKLLEFFIMRKLSDGLWSFLWCHNLWYFLFFGFLTNNIASKRILKLTIWKKRLLILFKKLSI